MPKYRAIVEGQNILFMVDKEPQKLDFHRALCIEAECMDSATKQALDHVLDELIAQQVLPQENLCFSNVGVRYIEQVDILKKPCRDQDFIWYFPDDAIFDYKLKKKS